MASVFDVAAYILRKHGPMTALKLQKLVYYAQAWSLVWDERPLFRQRIEAWANGPVVQALYQRHRGQFKLSKNDIDGNHAGLKTWELETIDAVLKAYGPKSSQWLSDLTHSERPWQDARQGLKPGERGDRVITHESMASYYASL